MMDMGILQISPLKKHYNVTVGGLLATMASRMRQPPDQMTVYEKLRKGALAAQFAFRCPARIGSRHADAGHRVK